MARISRNPLDPPVADAILAAALRQFGKSGYDASMKVIAKDAGVTAAALYYHYKDKRDLLFKGLEWMAQGVLRACTPTANVDKDPARALTHFVSAYIRHQLTQLAPIAPMYTSLVHGTRRQQDRLTPSQQKTLRTLEHEVLNVLRGLLEAGKTQRVFRVENPKLAAFAIIGMCEHTLNWVNPAGEFEVDEIANYYARLARRIVGIST